MQKCKSGLADQSRKLLTVSQGRSTHLVISLKLADTSLASLDTLMYLMDPPPSPITVSWVFFSERIWKDGHLYKRA